MSLIQFLTAIPTELRLEILNLAGGKAVANLSLTCQAAKELIQADDELWMELGKEELCDIRKRMGYEDYLKKARSMGWYCSAYGWFRYIVTNCCTVCLWFCSNGLVKHGKIRLCTDCERDIRAYEKTYDV